LVGNTVNVGGPTNKSGCLPTTAFKAKKFLTLMLSLILRRIFLKFGQQKSVLELLRPYVGKFQRFFNFFAVLGGLIIIKNIYLLTRMLRPLCAC